MLIADFSSFIGLGLCGFGFLCGCLGILLRKYGQSNPDVKSTAKNAVAGAAKRIIGKYVK
jgi:hypothetical protein